MEKFKERKIVNIAQIIIMIIGVSWLLSLFLVFISDKFLLGFLLLPCAIPFLIISFCYSTRDKYTNEFLIYIRKKLNNASNLEELIAIEKEFLRLATEDKMYCLSYPVNLKQIHIEINSKIDILQKQINKNGN